MNETLFTVSLLGFAITVTPWKLVGWTGVMMFGGRWIVQMVASRRSGRPVVPILFWYMSVAGSLLCLLYFIFGKNDSVGILNNLFPTAVAAYNLTLEVRHRSRKKRGAQEAAAGVSPEPLRASSPSKPQTAES